MKWPKLNFILPKFLQSKTGEPKKVSFSRIWKRFVHQIPREFRSITKYHQPFLVLGDEKSGKTELSHGIVEQGQNIYPFEVEYSKDISMQFYLGPKQVVQEMSIGVVKDRTISIRRSLIQLWRRLYVRKPPIVVIAYHCWTALSDDKREVSKAASMIAGKLSLLAEIVKEPLKIRLALTHLDKIDGYLELASFLKQHNLIFELPLDSNFESQALEKSLGVWRDQYLSLILTTVSADDFQKIVKFFEELPKFFRGLEEYLRALMTGNISGELVLEKLTFSSKLEPYTSYSTFDWIAPESNSIFFRHPMLKHQLAGAALFVVCAGLILNNFYKDRKQVNLTEQGVEDLDYLLPQVFVEEVIPQIENLNQNRPKEGYLSILPRFYKTQLRDTNQNLAIRIRQQILDPTLRKIMLQEQPEIKILYMLGLVYATHDNRLGKEIIKNIHDWSTTLDLDERVIRSYITSNFDNSENKIEIEFLDIINTEKPLTSPAPWIKFLGTFQDIVDQPIFTGLNFNSLRKEAQDLLSEYRRFKNDPHASTICSALDKANARMHQELVRNKKILDFLKKDGATLEDFLINLCKTCPEIPDITNHNITQFFSKINEITSLNGKDYKTYIFEIRGEKFSINTSKWVSMSVAHLVERLINNYIVLNHDSQGDIFFKNTPLIADLVVTSYRNEFPHFDTDVVINGRYTRLAFEKNVRNTAESLLQLLQSLPLNMEDKDRFTQFVQDEVVSYAKQYQAEYDRLYTACNIKSASLEEVKLILKKIAEPSSSFRHFLNTVHHHTEVFEHPSEVLRALEEKNHFGFLKHFIGEGKNKASAFEKYQTLIKHLIAHLEQPFDVRSYANVTNLEDVLSPSARLSLSILREDADSYLNRVKELLLQHEVVDDKYHQLFIAPVMQINKLGLKDLRRGVDKVWADALQPKIQQLFAKRPFNFDGTALSTYDEVHQVTNPKGEVWSVIQQIITPVSISLGGQWIPKHDADLQLDDAMYKAVNRLAKVSNLLWDNEGNPQPIRFNIQSLPFESVEETPPQNFLSYLPFNPMDSTIQQPILSYLVTGEETFHNFNQSPEWHAINIEWWKESSSTIVLELASKKDSRSYRDEKVLDTTWSFYELLKKATPKQDHVWEWTLGNLQNNQVSHVALKFEQDPWELFQNEELR